MDESLKNKEELLAELQNTHRELEKYRRIVQNANSIIMQMNAHGNITFFNAFAQRFFGYYENEIIGKSVLDTIVPKADADGADLEAMIDDIVRNPERHFVNENENIRRGGERVWIAWSNKALIDEDGQINEILCVGNDITKYKKAGPGS